MRKTLFAFVALLLFAVQTGAQNLVVPAAYENTNAPSSFLSPLSNTARTCQFILNASQLTGMIGKNITGISFRSAASLTTSWPAADESYSNYDIYVGEGVAPASKSTTFASNFVSTPTQVRTGSLLIRAGDYPAGGPGSWGPSIEFATPYVYSGGHLTVELRHSTFSSSRNNNAVTTSEPGYNTDFASVWNTGYTATAGTQGFFCVLRLNSPGTVLPTALEHFTAGPEPNAIKLDWRTQTEENLAGFTVEESADGVAFRGVAAVKAIAANGSGSSYTQRLNAGGKLAGTWYYRLRMNDRDGSFRHSAIKEVRIGKALPGVTLLRNPVQDVAELRFNAAQSGPVNYLLSDLSGQVVTRGTLQALAGNNFLRLPVSHLSKGQFVFSLSGSSGSIGTGMMTKL